MWGLLASVRCHLILEKQVFVHLSKMLSRESNLVSHGSRTRLTISTKPQELDASSLQNLTLLELLYMPPSPPHTHTNIHNNITYYYSNFRCNVCTVDHHLSPSPLPLVTSHRLTRSEGGRGSPSCGPPSSVSLRATDNFACAAVILHPPYFAWNVRSLHIMTTRRAPCKERAAHQHRRGEFN